MFRKCMMLLPLAITGVILSLTAANSTQGQDLKKDAPANEADAIIADTQRMLAKIPSVREIRAGRPAEKGAAVVVKDYQVGLLVLFDDGEDMQAYVDHPLHKEFVTGHEKSFEKVVVYDFVSKEP